MFQTKQNILTFFHLTEVYLRPGEESLLELFCEYSLQFLVICLDSFYSNHLIQTPVFG